MSTGLFIAWLVTLLNVGMHPSPAIAKIDTDRLMLAKYAYDQATEQNIDPKKFIKLMACESEINPNAAGDFRSETKEYMANGPYQFWRQTFDIYSTQYGIDGASYDDPYDQVHLASLMIRDGMWRAWYNCGKVAGYLKK